MPPAARISDLVKQDAPHCHAAPIHPAAPVPTPVPHPGLPLPIIKGQPQCPHWRPSGSAWHGHDSSMHSTPVVSQRGPE